MDNFTRTLRTLKQQGNQEFHICVYHIAIMFDCCSLFVWILPYISWFIAIRTKTIQVSDDEVSALLPLAKVRNSGLLPFGIFAIECSIFGSIGGKIHLSLFEKRLLPKCCLMIRVSGSETSLHKLLCKNFYGGWFEIHVHGVRTLHT